jgi:hypothetical protein
VLRKQVIMRDLKENLMKLKPVSLLLLSVIGWCCEASAATIVGRVSDNNGNLLTGAQVNLTPSVSMSRGSTRLTGVIGSPASVVSTRVSSAGQFEFDNVALGNYSLCVVPNNRKHINSCTTPRLGHISVQVPADTLINADLHAVVGVPILLTIVVAETAKLPTHAFLDSVDGGFFPMEIDGQPGHFWVVVPPLSDLRVVTAIAGGHVAPPGEIVHAGAANVPVAITVSR